MVAMARTLTFPENYIVGELFSLNKGMPTYIGQATGNVQIADDAQVKLCVSGDGAINLGWVKELDPANIHTFSVYAQRVNLADFPHLTVLQELVELDLGQLKPHKMIRFGKSDEMAMVPGQPGDVDRALNILGKFPRLKRLVLAESGAGDNCLDHLRTSHALELLDLERTAIGDTAISNLCLLKELKILDLEGTAVGDASLAQICCIDSMQVLDVDGTQVTDAGVVYLARLKNLRWLRAANTKIQGTTLGYLQQLPNLHTIELAGTPVNDQTVPVLCTMKQLTELIVSNSQISAQGIQRLKQALPNCEVQ
jgi:hypothetical protein